MLQINYVSSDGFETRLPDEAVDEFRAAMGGDVLTPDSEQYDEVRVIWNGKYHDKRPGLIAR